MSVIQETLMLLDGETKSRDRADNSSHQVSVSERIARIREHLSIEDNPTPQPKMERTFSKQSAPLFEKSFGQIYNQWQQNSKK